MHSLNFLWTLSKARLRWIKSTPGSNFNWIFVPGGPGLGSESLVQLTEMLNLPGTFWHFDFSDDGSNIIENTGENFGLHWSNGLLEVTAALPNVILVTHSAGGMFALATPDLEKNLKGLVLMDSAPDFTWQKFFSDHVSRHPIAKMSQLQSQYEKNPSNDLLKQLVKVCVPYFSMSISQDKLLKIIDTLPINFKSHLWAHKYFDKTYQAKWVPQNVATLIFAGSDDHITPIELFIEQPEFQRKNIAIKKITHAGHFPWLENSPQILLEFEQFYQRL